MLLACARSLAIAGIGMSGSWLTAAEPLPFLHPLFADHAVFPRDRAAPIWGWTAPGATVRVALGSAHAEAIANADGRWQAALGPLAAGGPYALTVDGPQHVVCNDVMVGDVWLFSGQSNMEMGVGGAAGAAEENAQAGNVTNLRIMSLGHRLAGTPQVVPAGPAPLWQVPQSGNIGGFSAVAWYTGRQLANDLKIPIGVVACAWGGSNIRGWMANETLNTLGLYGDERADLAKLVTIAAAGGPDVSTQERTIIAAWWQDRDPGTSGAFAQPATPATGTWSTITVPLSGAPVPNGVIWLRREIDLPATAAGKSGRLRLGAMLDEETTWINGTQVGNTGGWNGPRTHQIPAKLLQAGRNVIAIRTLADGGRGGPHGQAADWSVDLDGQAPVTLAGEWQMAATAPAAVIPTKPVPRFQGGNRSVTMLYQGGIQPLAPFGFTGAVWYQGEQDAGNQDYYRLLPALIADWRTLFAAPQLPFIVVQLPNFGPRIPDPVQPQVWFGLVRDAQLQAALNVPQVGLAVTTDLGDPADVHPKRKHEVGERVARAALGIAYGRDDAGGGLYAGMTVEGAAIRVRFSRLHGGLALHPDEPSGFAIAGADGHWHHATARVDGATVVIAAPGIDAPHAVRYGWADSPPVTLYDQAGMPVSPFRSDQGH